MYLEKENHEKEEYEILSDIADSVSVSVQDKMLSLLSKDFDILSAAVSLSDGNRGAFWGIVAALFKNGRVFRSFLAK